MATAANPVYANVAFLRIPQFDARTVTEQAALKEKVEARARLAIAGVARIDRVVLDVEDGLAIILFGDPESALRIAESFNIGNAEPALQVGLNHGPLALAAGPDTRIFGDGLTAAAAAASFAQPRKLFVTQDFALALERRNPARAAELAIAGEFTDTRVRQHSFYTPDTKRVGAYRRRMIGYGIAGVLAILAVGLATRQVVKRLFPPPPAIVTLNIKPRGEVYVDSAYKGTVPPMQQVELSAGIHVFEIRNARGAPYTTTLELKPGEHADITYTFVRPATPTRPQVHPQQAPGFWGRPQAQVRRHGMTTPATAKFGRFEVIDVLGRGAMGVVYRARDSALGRTVAIKTISLTGSAEERNVHEARFMQEARAAGSISHPAIITIYDVGREGDTAFIAMELLEGRDLRDMISTREPHADAIDRDCRVRCGRTRFCP